MAKIKIKKSDFDRLVKEELNSIVAESKKRKRRRKSVNETLETGITEPEKISAEETDASEYGTALAQDIDFMKALKIEEAKLVKRLNTIRETKSRVARKITSKIS